MSAEWSRRLSALALEEGWDVFDNFDYGTRIERLDDPASVEELAFTEPKFDGDDEAIAHVRARAAQGSLLHQTAIAIHDA